MKRSELEQIIRDEIQKELAERVALSEKSVPEPYNRNSPPRREMTKSQISQRDKIGNAMEKDKKTVARFRNKFEDEWRDYLWAAATNKVLGPRE